MIPKFFLSLLLFSFFTASCQKRAEDCIYIIPKGFEGNVLIIFDQPNGTDTLYENGKRVYKVDTTGVLRTKFKANYGIKAMNLYFSADAKGNRAKLNYLTPIGTLKDSNMVVCMIHETGSDVNKRNGKKRYFERFIVSTIAHSDSVANQRSEFMTNELEK